MNHVIYPNPEGVAYLDGKVSSVTQGTESMSFTYDGKLVTNVARTGTLAESIALTYNNDFAVDSMTYASITFGLVGSSPSSSAISFSRASHPILGSS